MVIEVSPAESPTSGVSGGREEFLACGLLQEELADLEELQMALSSPKCLLQPVVKVGRERIVVNPFRTSCAGGGGVQQRRSDGDEEGPPSSGHQHSCTPPYPPHLPHPKLPVRRLIPY